MRVVLSTEVLRYISRRVHQLSPFCTLPAVVYLSSYFDGARRDCIVESGDSSSFVDAFYEVASRATVGK